MTTITPVPMAQTQAPAFRGKTTKAQQKAVDTANKVVRDSQLKEMMKTAPERAKEMITRDSLIAILDSVDKGYTTLKQATIKIQNLLKNI